MTSPRPTVLERCVYSKHHHSSSTARDPLFGPWMETVLGEQDLGTLALGTLF